MISKLKPIICPSILNADLARLAAECENLLEMGADRLHLDVMDHHFVPNLSFGPPVVASLRKALGSRPFLDVHLMVETPERYIEDMSKGGADLFTFHLEAVQGVEKINEVIKKIRNANMKVGIAIKPKTDVEQLLPFCATIDQALVMTVEPGFGGQSFMIDMMPKVERLRKDFPDLDIQVDGGIGQDNIEISANAGANVIVSGTALVKSNDRRKVIEIMKSAVSDAIRKI